jgi:hypothetical protein
VKPTTVRGTPVRFISAGNEGMAAGKPANMSGTTSKQFQGDQSNKVDARSGTAYNSQNGNSPTAKRVASSDKYGMVVSENGINMSNPESNGNGVVFAGVGGMSILPASMPQTMDSPVPEGAQRPIENAPGILANLRSGSGSQWGANGGPSNTFLDMGGVMTRGMVGTSTPTGGPDELLEDDVLRNLGPGGAVG